MGTCFLHTQRRYLILTLDLFRMYRDCSDAADVLEKQNSFLQTMHEDHQQSRRDHETYFPPDDLYALHDHSSQSSEQEETLVDSFGNTILPDKMVTKQSIVLPQDNCESSEPSNSDNVDICSSFDEEKLKILVPGAT